MAFKVAVDSCVLAVGCWTSAVIDTRGAVNRMNSGIQENVAVEKKKKRKLTSGEYYVSYYYEITTTLK